MQKGYGYFYASMEDMVGRTFLSVDNDSESITFYEEDGSYFQMFHQQDCCEYVRVEDIVGELTDLVGTPITYAIESSSESEEAYESGTWTFYKLATIKGWVDIRWLGESNGYYSESVSLLYYPAKEENNG